METTTRICDSCGNRIAQTSCDICNNDLCENCEFDSAINLKIAHNASPAQRYLSIFRFKICPKCRINFELISENRINQELRKSILDHINNEIALAKIEGRTGKKEEEIKLPHIPLSPSTGIYRSPVSIPQGISPSSFTHISPPGTRISTNRLQTQKRKGGIKQ